MFCFLFSAIEEERKRQKFLYNHFDLAIKRSRVQKIRVCSKKFFLFIQLNI